MILTCWQCLFCSCLFFSLFICSAILDDSLKMMSICVSMGQPTTSQFGWSRARPKAFHRQYYLDDQNLQMRLPPVQACILIFRSKKNVQVLYTHIPSDTTTSTYKFIVLVRQCMHMTYVYRYPLTQYRRTEVTCVTQVRQITHLTRLIYVLSIPYIHTLCIHTSRPTNLKANVLDTRCIRYMPHMCQTLTYVTYIARVSRSLHVLRLLQLLQTCIIGCTDAFM